MSSRSWLDQKRLSPRSVSGKPDYQMLNFRALFAQALVEVPADHIRNGHVVNRVTMKTMNR